jgi:hypothetical protein
MTNFANQIKSEIARIAKKEVRAETQQLKKLPHSTAQTLLL